MLFFLFRFGDALWQAVSASCPHVAACLPPTVPDLPGAKWAQSAIYTALPNNAISGLSSLHAFLLNAQRYRATSWSDDQNVPDQEELLKQLDYVYFPDFFSSSRNSLSFWQHLALRSAIGLWEKLFSWHHPCSRMVVFACLLRNMNCQMNLQMPEQMASASSPRQRDHCIWQSLFFLMLFMSAFTGAVTQLCRLWVFSS